MFNVNNQWCFTAYRLFFADRFPVCIITDPCHHLRHQYHHHHHHHHHGYCRCHPLIIKTMAKEINVESLYENCWLSLITTSPLPLSLKLSTWFGHENIWQVTTCGVVNKKWAVIYWLRRFCFIFVFTKCLITCNVFQNYNEMFLSRFTINLFEYADLSRMCCKPLSKPISRQITCSTPWNIHIRPAIVDFTHILGHLHNYTEAFTQFVQCELNNLEE